MRILIVVSGYFPAQNYGGPPVSILNFCRLMSHDIDCYIVTSNHEYGSKAELKGIGEGWQLQGNAHVRYLKESEMRVPYFQKILDEVKPDWIYLNSIFDMKRTYPFLSLAEQKNIRALIAPRGELCKNAFKKKYKKIPYLWALKKYWKSRLISFQSTSEEETEAIKKILHISPDRILLLDNIPTIPDFLHICNDKRSGELFLVFLSRIHPKKNLIFALNCIGQLHGNIRMAIYGPLENPDYWNDCLQIIANMPGNVQVSYQGVVKHAEVYNVLSGYQVFFLPTLSENYGHVIAEALLAGLPVMISDQTPWNDVNKAEAGWAISLNNQKEFIDNLQKLVDMNGVEFQRISRNAIEFVKSRVDVKRIREEYLGVLHGNE